VLFDLQSPGRRRVIRVVFGALAAVFAISTVFLGVGTGGGGSIGDLFGGGGGDNSGAFDDQIKAQEQRLVVNPNDAAALAQLVQLHYSAGNTEVDDNGQLNSDGEQQLQQSADAWNRYVKASKGNVANGPALYALQTFDRLGSTEFDNARSAGSGTEALDSVNSAIADWKSAAQAQQILIDKQPSGTAYARLASYLYLSGQTQAGDQAAAKAKSSSQGSQGNSIDTQLKPIQQLGQQLQQAVTQLAQQQKQQQASTGGSNPLSGAGGGASALSPGGLSGGGLSGGP
jgi:hypothetical protein